MRTILILVIALKSLVVFADEFRSIKNDEVIFYKDPNYKTPLFVVNKGFPVKLIRREKNGWALIEDYTKNQYWVAHNQLLKEPRTIMAIKDQVKVYEEKNSQSNISFTLLELSIVDLVDQQGGWVEVLHQSGKKGFAKSSDFYGTN